MGRAGSSKSECYSILNSASLHRNCSVAHRFKYGAREALLSLFPLKLGNSVHKITVISLDFAVNDNVTATVCSEITDTLSY